MALALALENSGLFLLILGKSNFFFSWEFSSKLSKVVKLLGKELLKENSNVLFLTAFS